MEKRRVHVWIEGRVQGVYFRACTQDAALDLGLKGWVRNLRDGRVEAVFEGDRDRVEKMIHWCRHEGSPGSRVDHVEVKEEDFTGELDRFELIA